MKPKLLKSMAVVAVMLLFAGTALAESDAELTLAPSVQQASKGDEFTVDVMLKNPSQQNVISVRTWLSYDPKALSATALDTSASPFALPAPGEDGISADEGRVMIGRANITGGVKDAQVKVATVHFKVLSAYKDKTTISFYDYQVNELGHTSVNIVDQGFPLNILGKEPDKLDIQLNPQGGTSVPATTPPATTQTTVPTTTAPSTSSDMGGEGFSTDLIRPTNLKVNTGSGYVDLVWDAPTDPARVGFNVYYGQTSGVYARRRTIGNTNAFRLDGLTNNETYYLAVTAFDSLNRESDYSNEVGVIVNQPLSSTAPFTTLFDQKYRKIPSEPQNGPLVGWLVISAAGLSAAILFGRKRQRILIQDAE
jgi:Cohesin domain